MKVTFNHELIIKESRVFEVLGLLMALCNPQAHMETLPQDPFDDILQAPAFLKWKDLVSPYPRFQFALYEFALLSRERDRVADFFKDLVGVPNSKLLRAFFGSEISLAEAEEPLETIFHNQTLTLTESMKEAMNPMTTLLDYGKAAALLIDDHPYFNLKFKDLMENGVYERQVDRFKRGTLDQHRHPLSYTQELMGKPFWNIADYRVYELIPVHFFSPYSMRLMDENTMIYVGGMVKSPKRNLETPEQLAEILKVLADPMRLKLLKLIDIKPMYGKEISDALGISTPTVSHHLDLLLRHGLVNLEQVKHIKYFSTNYRRLQQVRHAQQSFFTTT